MLETVLRTIQDYTMVASGELVLVGVSGGPDSIALLHCLYRLANNLNFRLHVVHVNHGIRPESVEEAEFVAGFATRLGIGITVKTIDGKALKEHGSFQERAREARREIFAAIGGQMGAAKIALGHNANDQAETVLQRLLRGGGSSGLGGILPKRGSIIRPLLFVQRHQIEKYLKEEGLDCRLDASNYEPIYLRNKIRLELIPWLEEKYNPRVVEALGKTALILQEENSYLNLEAEKKLAELVKTFGDGYFLPLTAFALALPILRRMVRQLFSQLSGDPRGLEYDHVARVLDFAVRGESGRYLELPSGIRVYKEQAGVLFTAGELVLPRLEETILRVPGETRLSAVNIVMRARVVDNPKHFPLPEGCWSIVLDYDQLDFPLILRSRLPGDRLWKHGSFTKIKEIFSRQKVPVRDRDTRPLLVQGDEVLWIPGLTRSDRAGVVPATSKILELVAIKNSF